MTQPSPAMMKMDRIEKLENYLAEVEEKLAVEKRRSLELQAQLEEMNRNCISLSLHESRVSQLTQELARSKAGREFWIEEWNDGDWNTSTCWQRNVPGVKLIHAREIIPPNHANVTDDPATWPSDA